MYTLINDDHNRSGDRNLLRWYLILSAITISLVLLIATAVHAETIIEMRPESIASCLDARNLPEGTKKAYKALKSNGYDVKVVCKEKQKPLTAEQLKAIEEINK